MDKNMDTKIDLVTVSLHFNVFEDLYRVLINSSINFQ